MELTITGKFVDHEDAAFEEAKKALSEYYDSYPKEYSTQEPYWYKWNLPHHASHATSGTDVFIDWTPADIVHEAYNPGLTASPKSEELKIKLQSKPVVKFEPNPFGPFVSIGISIEFADDFFDTFGGCTGDAANVIIDTARASLMQQLVEWHKAKHEGGVWPNSAEAVGPNPTE